MSINQLTFTAVDTRCRWRWFRNIRRLLSMAVMCRPGKRSDICPQFTALGFSLTILGTLLAALKTIVTNMIQVGRLKLHPLDLLLRMSPLAFVQCVVCMVFTSKQPYCADTSDRLLVDGRTQPSARIWSDANDFPARSSTAHKRMLCVLAQHCQLFGKQEDECFDDDCVW